MSFVDNICLANGLCKPCSCGQTLDGITNTIIRGLSMAGGEESPINMNLDVIVMEAQVSKIHTVFVLLRTPITEVVHLMDIIPN